MKKIYLFTKNKVIPDIEVTNASIDKTFSKILLILSLSL